MDGGTTTLTKKNLEAMANAVVHTNNPEPINWRNSLRGVLLPNFRWNQQCNAFSRCGVLDCFSSPDRISDFPPSLHMHTGHLCLTEACMMGECAPLHTPTPMSGGGRRHPSQLCTLMAMFHFVLQSKLMEPAHDR